MRFFKCFLNKTKCQKICFIEQIIINVESIINHYLNAFYKEAVLF